MKKILLSLALFAPFVNAAQIKLSPEVTNEMLQKITDDDLADATRLLFEGKGRLGMELYPEFNWIGLTPIQGETPRTPGELPPENTPQTPVVDLDNLPQPEGDPVVDPPKPTQETNDSSGTETKCTTKQKCHTVEGPESCSEMEQACPMVGPCTTTTKVCRSTTARVCYPEETCVTVSK